MSYKLKFSTRRFEGLFGTAYPRLNSIPTYKKTHYLARFLQDNDSTDIFIEHKEHDWPPFLKYYEILIHDDGKRGYDKAVEVEKACLGLKCLSFFSPPRWWNRFMLFRRPSDSFMVNDIACAKLFTWLNENCKPRDYQIYTKFDEDISIGFRSGETAAMFKLTFGNKDI